MMKQVIFIICGIVLSLLLITSGSCTGRTGTRKGTENLWSIKMAENVMTLADSLIHYVEGRPRW
ncbi:MAG: hypothetical protein GT600_15010, partial [Bacteroidales bacterium]|nr:hypothetical protein [Bacteroidales bacterium]